MQWLMLQQNEPEDYVISSGEQHSVRDFVILAAKHLNMDLTWTGEGIDEVAKWNGKPILKIDPRYYRPTEVETLLGDSSKAKEKLGWETKISFEELVAEMVLSDLKSANKDKLNKENGFDIKSYNE